ncbi:unnamed protein product [marine sediment metagenome]|uniref:Uncharacterized protein n=1 Tax=marine sediment metagenome TaxID=412755 RepID=X1QF06_9ZZZZ
MNEKEKLLEQINKLTPVEFSKLCLRVVKTIVKKEPAENYLLKAEKEDLVKLMLEYDVKMNDNDKNQ